MSSATTGTPWVANPAPKSSAASRKLDPFAVAQRPHAQDERTHGHHAANVLGRVHVEVAVQLVVQDRKREQRQERREPAQAELAAERPQARGKAGRRDPQERPHRRQR